MTMTRWKLAAGTIGLSLGVAILAGNSASPAVVQAKDAPKSSQSTSRKPPSENEPSVMSFELMVPLALPMPEPLPAADPVAPVPLVLPPLSPPANPLPIGLPLELPLPTPPVPSVPVLPLPTPPAYRVELTFPPVIDDNPPIRATSYTAGPESTPMPRTIVRPPENATSHGLANGVPVPKPPTAPVPLPPVAVPTPVEGEPSKLKMTMRLGDGTPRFEIRNHTGEVLLLKVYAERIEVQNRGESHKNSLRGVNASEKVRFSGPGVEGTCDTISVISGTGEVLMAGNIRMRTKVGRHWSEMTADKVVYQIGAGGLKSVPKTTTAIDRIDGRTE